MVNSTLQYNPTTDANTTSTITLLSTLYANTNVDTYDETMFTVLTPYVLFVNVQNWSNFFLERSYKDTNDTVEVNLVVNVDYLANNIFNTDTTSVYYKGIQGTSEPNDYLGLETVNVTGELVGETMVYTQTATIKKLGFRLLEMSALKMFKNAKSRAVIKNDVAFIDGTINNFHDTNSLYTSLANQINTAFSTDKMTIFNQYINTGRYPGEPDATGHINFNFTEVNFQVKLTYQSSTASPIANVGNYTNNFTNNILLILGSSYDANSFIAHSDSTMVNHS